MSSENTTSEKRWNALYLAALRVEKEPNLSRDERRLITALRLMAGRHHYAAKGRHSITIINQRATA